VIDGGSVRYGRLLCPHCSTSQRLIEVGRSTGRPPAWRLFAVEAIPAPQDGRPMPLSARQFFAATDADLRAYAQASAALQQRLGRDGQLAWLPTAEIPRSGRADTRLIDYGYRRYTDLFNDRLQEWETFYNFNRPHGGLGGQTPYERLRDKTRARA